MNRLEFLKRLAGSIAGLVVGTKLARAAAPITLPKIVAEEVEASGISQILLLEQAGLVGLSGSTYPEWGTTNNGPTRPLTAADIREMRKRILEDDGCRQCIHVPRGTHL